MAEDDYRNAYLQNRNLSVLLYKKEINVYRYQSHQSNKLRYFPWRNSFPSLRRSPVPTTKDTETGDQARPPAKVAGGFGENNMLYWAE